MLDSDNLPLVNPETLFESKGYKKHGNLFWPDYWDAIQGNQPGWLTDSAYTLFGLNPPWQEDPSGFATTETGQILINRCAHSLFPQVLQDRTVFTFLCIPCAWRSGELFSDTWTQQHAPLLGRCPVTCTQHGRQAKHSVSLAPGS